MPDPFSAGTAVISGSLQLASGLAAASAARRRAEFEAAMLEQNADLADFLAADTRARGSYEEAVSRLRGGAKIGEQKAAYGASGVDVQSGSALDVIGSTAMVSEMEAEVIRSNATREAWGYSTSANQMRFRAKLARVTGEAQASESVLNGVIGGAAQFVPLLRIGNGSGGGNIPSHTDFNDQGI